MKYEKEIFENITKLRTEYNATKDIKINQELNNKMDTIIASVENYPELKASEQFLNLQKNLEKIESQLQAARRVYNSSVTAYNIKVSIIPYIIIAYLFNFKKEPLFELESKNASENIKVEL